MRWLVPLGVVGILSFWLERRDCLRGQNANFGLGIKVTSQSERSRWWKDKLDRLLLPAARIHFGLGADFNRGPLAGSE